MTSAVHAAIPHSAERNGGRGTHQTMVMTAVAGKKGEARIKPLVEMIPVQKTAVAGKKRGSGWKLQVIPIQEQWRRAMVMVMPKAPALLMTRPPALVMTGPPALVMTRPRLR